MAKVLEDLREHHKADLIDLVKMHLSFLVDVTSEEWEKIVCYAEQEVEQQQQLDKSDPKIRDKSADSQNTTKYFTSATLTDSSKLNKKFRPPIEKELASNIFENPLSENSLRQAMILVDFLNEDGNFDFEGIFRKSGSKERQQDLRFMLNNGARVDLKANRFTPVDVSCVLKEFVQKLPEPLLTTNHFELHFELSKAIKCETSADELEARNAKRLKIVQLLIHLIPDLNRRFFISLMRLLHRVAQALEVTKMDEKSIATMFGQHVMCPRSWSAKQISRNIDIINDALEFLLINYNHLFSGPVELILDARKKMEMRSRESKNKDKQAGDCDENNTVVTFCQRKQSQDNVTDQAMAELYAQIHSMPETPQKKKLIKKFNRHNGFGTPVVAGSQIGVTSSQIGSASSTSSKWKSLFKTIVPSHK